MKITINEAAELLKNADQIALLSHAEPDGDTIGSAFALGLALQKLGKQVMHVCADPVPEKYRYFTAELKKEVFSPALTVSVDVADFKLLGSAGAAYPKIDLAIDHHGSHRSFGEKEYIDSGCVACAMVVKELVDLLQSGYTKAMADALYTGLVTDSGCFLYPDTSPRAHRIAAFLMEQGADYAEINRLMFETKTKGHMALEQLCLKKLQFHFDGLCAISLLEEEELSQIDYTQMDFEGIASLPREIEGVEVGILLRAKRPGVYKASIRTNRYVDASALCGLFGGGGHVHASGCTIEGTGAEVAARLLAAVEKALKNDRPEG